MDQLEGLARLGAISLLTDGCNIYAIVRYGGAADVEDHYHLASLADLAEAVAEGEKHYGASMWSCTIFGRDAKP